MKFTRKTKILTGLLCAAIYSIPLLPINGALNIFMKGVSGPFSKGEVTTKGFEGYIWIESFSIGGSNPVTIGPIGGTAGKPSFSSLNVMKRVDSLSPSFFGVMATGTVLPEMFLLTRTTTYPGYQIKISLRNPMIESVQWSGSSGSDGYESVSIAFEAIKIEYFPIDSNGVTSGTPTNTMVYDLKAATVNY